MSEDPGEIAEVARLFPEARDYVDVYDRAGGLGERSVLAHAIHLSDRGAGADRRDAGRRVSHCPASNLFIGAGVMPLARWLEAGVAVGLGSDVSGGPDPSLFSRDARRGATPRWRAGRWRRRSCGRRLAPLDWLRLGTLDGARALGLERRIGSLEAGQGGRYDRRGSGDDGAASGAADEDATLLDDPGALVSRLIFRAHPDMVRGAWVRGRLLEGPS